MATSRRQRSTAVSECEAEFESETDGVSDAAFPLTPALSLEEREPLSAAILSGSSFSGAARRASIWSRVRNFGRRLASLGSARFLMGVAARTPLRTRNLQN